ncbi:Cytochrome oxidase Cu insertion factor, SCO1/SenC/PrrC family [bacterium A37T11]|nr:Cytochrome oxidase Cu insertion factor, SCO1/SenC/PrrC family [bacterium A37T11]
MRIVIISLILTTSLFKLANAQSSIYVPKSKNEINASHPLAYQFHLPDTSGRIYSNRDFKGKIVIMDFWNTGCGPCTGMSKTLHKLSDSLSKIMKDVVFVSINTDKDINIWKKSVISGLYTHPGEINLNAPPLENEIAIQKYYRIEAHPSLVVLDKSGGVISFGPGFFYIVKGIKETEISRSAIRDLILKDIDREMIPELFWCKNNSDNH